MLTHFMHSSWLRGVILEEWYTSAQASTDFHKFSLFTNFYKSQILTNFLFFYKFLRVYSFPHISSTPCMHFSPILSLFLFLSLPERVSPHHSSSKLSHITQSKNLLAYNSRYSKHQQTKEKHTLVDGCRMVLLGEMEYFFCFIPCRNNFKRKIRAPCILNGIERIHFCVFFPYTLS